MPSARPSRVCGRSAVPEWLESSLPLSLALSVLPGRAGDWDLVPPVVDHAVHYPVGLVLLRLRVERGVCSPGDDLEGPGEILGKGDGALPQSPRPHLPLFLPGLLQVSASPRLPSINGDVNVNNRSPTAAPRVSFDSELVVIRVKLSVESRFDDQGLHRALLNRNANGCLVVLVPVDGRLNLRRDHLRDPLDVAHSKPSRADKTDGVAVISRKRLSVHFIRQKDVSICRHGFLDRDTACEGDVRLIFVQSLHLHKVHPTAIGVQPCVHQDVAQARAPPQRVTHRCVKEGADDKLLLVLEVRPSHSVAGTLESGHDFGLWELRLEVVQCEHEVLANLPSEGGADGQPVGFRVHQRHRQVAADVVQLGRGDEVLNQQLRRGLSVEWLFRVNNHGRVPSFFQTLRVMSEWIVLILVCIFNEVGRCNVSNPHSFQEPESPSALVLLEQKPERPNVLPDCKQNLGSTRMVVHKLRDVVDTATERDPLLHFGAAMLRHLCASEGWQTLLDFASYK
mmetsp:Transcript_15004/g.35397  ORF Transcript_15004/g.35397 Transcript_15004/m.35397 type:complete len:509 (+) Transcript_15004:165-1691(+)